MSLRQTFEALQGSAVELHLVASIARHTAIGEERHAVVLGGKAGRALTANMPACLEHVVGREVTLYLDRIVTQLKTDGPQTTLLDLTGLVEGITDGLLRVRSRTVQGKGLRMYIPTNWVLFFARQDGPLGDGPPVDTREVVLELEGEGRSGQKAYIYVPERAVAYLSEPLALALA